MKKFVLLSIIFLFATVGCAGNQAGRADLYKFWLTTKANQQVPKSCEIEFEKDKPVTGIKKITCYSNNLRSLPPPPVSRPHPAWGVIETAIKAGANVAGMSIIGNTLTDLADVIGRNSGHNISDSYNSSQSSVDDSIHDSYNTDESINDSYNTDESINDSYNTDDHSTNENWTDDHSTLAPATP